MRLPHAAGVMAVAFSPDGALLSTASNDGSVRLWALSSGTERLRAAHPGGSEVVAFSPDGQYVASGSISGELDMWSLTRGDERARMLHAGEVDVVAASVDGKMAATGERGMVHLWPLQGQTKGSAPKVPGGRIDRLVFSDDGAHLAAASSSGLFVIDANPAIAVKQLVDSRAASHVAISARYAVAFDRLHRALRAWEIETARELAPLSTEPLTDPAFDASGTFIAAKQQDARGNGSIRVWALPDWREQGKLPIKGSSSFALGPQGRLIAMEVFESSGDKGTNTHYIDVYEAAGNRRVARIPGGEEVRIAFHPGGETLFLVAENEVRIFDPGTGKLRASLRHEQDVDKLRMSPERDVLATLSRGSVYVWNYATGELLTQLVGDDYFQDMRFAGNGRYLLTGSRDHTAVLWLWKPEDLREEACRRLNRNLTAAEWARHLGAMPYEKSCPNVKADAK
jgi:WD40 repeat protein